MSEEVHNAAVTVPRSMMISLVFNGTVGFAMLVAELFCIPDPVGLLGLGLQYPFVQIFFDATGSTVGSALMVSIIIFNQIALNTTNVAAASRVLWSFSRDQGIPGWQHVSKLAKRSSLPVNAILVTATFTLLVTLINIGSAVAFNDVISLTIDSLFASYLLACSLLLWRRCQGTIVPYSQAPYHDPGVNAPGADGRLTWGPFHMKGYFGILVNALACAYMVIIIFFSFWPPGTPTTGATMNYALVMFSSVAIIATAYYLIWARKTFKGPIVETVGSQ